jgi:hypothetical protein
VSYVFAALCVTSVPYEDFMHRRAHGGAWSAAVLMIGSCSASLAAEPPRAGGYSSGTSSSNAAISSGGAISNGAGSSNVSTFVPHPGSTSAFTPPTGNGLTPVAGNSAAAARAIEIVPTPFVPYASVLAQQGRVFSPATVANVPMPMPTVTPNSLGSANSPGWIAKEGTRAPMSPIAGSPVAINAPLVPVILPEAERALLEKALRGAGAPSTDEVEAGSVKPPAVSSTAAEPIAAEPIAARAGAKPAASTPDAAESDASAAPAKSSETAAKKLPAVKEEVAVVSPAKITPLPPLEREEPSGPSPTMNLPQPPIPLEYPRTGR